jgi:hypothetical protein
MISSVVRGSSLQPPKNRSISEATRAWRTLSVSLTLSRKRRDNANLSLADRRCALLQTLSIEIPISVYITIDYGSKDKDIIAKKQVFPAFSASILVNSYFTSLAEIWRSEDCLLTLQLEIKKTRNGRRKIIGFRAYRG